MTLETCQRIEATLNQWLRVCYLHNRDGVPVNSPWIDGLPQCAGVIAEEIDRLQRELAEARAYISTIIDAPGVNNG